MKMPSGPSPYPRRSPRIAHNQLSHSAQHPRRALARQKHDFLGTEVHENSTLKQKTAMHRISCMLCARSPRYPSHRPLVCFGALAKEFEVADSVGHLWIAMASAAKWFLLHCWSIVGELPCKRIRAQFRQQAGARIIAGSARVIATAGRGLRYSREERRLFQAGAGVLADKGEGYSREGRGL